MKTSKILVIAIFVSLLFLMPLMVSASTPDDLKVTIKTDKMQYRWLFDKIDITLTLTNTGNESANISFPTFQFFDIIVVNHQKTRIVYVWSYGQMFPQMIINATITPGASMIWHYAWNKHQNVHYLPIFLPVFPGRYQIIGTVMAIGITTPYATTNVSIGPVISPFY
jgi:hypothetical protein